MKLVTKIAVREMGQDLYVFYDREYSPLSVPTDYYMYMADKERNQSTLAKTVTDMTRLFTFLQLTTINRDWLSMDDKLLKEYRNWHLKQVQATEQYRGKVNQAKRTTNDALRRTYQFYRWAQEEKLNLGLLGETADGANIYSRLTTRHNHKDNVGLYPLIYKQVGEGTRHRVPKSASEDDYKELVALIHSSSFSYIRARDALILRIINEQGQRPDAIDSLTIHDFSDEMIAETEKRGETKFWVTPQRQKMGYENGFGFDMKVLYSIQAYIKGARQTLLADKKQGCDEGKLLLTKRGLPLACGGRSITFRFCYLKKKLGWPTGKSIYAFRHKWMNELLDKEIRIAMEIGGDLSSDGIKGAVAKEAGHASLLSQESYIRARNTIGESTLATQDHKKLTELRVELETYAEQEATLLGQIAHYEQLIDLYEKMLVKHGITNSIVK